jgi:hypothetical protein
MNTDSHRRSRYTGNLLLGALLLGGSFTAAADDSLTQQTFQVALGVFINGSALEIQANGRTLDNASEVDWENTFGDEDVNRFRVDALWRISDRHHLRLMYTDYSRRDTRRIDREIQWQDEIFPIGVEVEGNLGFEIFELAYEFAFLHSERFELAGGIGLHYTTFEAGLEATVTAPVGSGTREIGGTASLDAPLPVIGVHALWRMIGSFYLEGQAQAFALSIDEYDGEILNLRAALIWQPTALLGIGVGYDYFQVDLDIERPRFNGSMDWIYSGPQLFVSVSF